MSKATTTRIITGAARPMVAAVGAEQAVALLVDQFGWDDTFAALAASDTPEACRALWWMVASLVG